MAARLAADAVSKAFDEAADHMHLVEEEQRVPKSGDDETDEDMDGLGRAARSSASRVPRQPAKKPVIPADEAEIWEVFKGQMAESVQAAVQGGTKLLDITGSVQALALKLSALLESKARACPMEPQLLPAAPGGGGEQMGPTAKDGLGDQQGQPMGTGRGAAVKGRAFSRSRSRGEESEGPR